MGLRATLKFEICNLYFTRAHSDKKLCWKKMRDMFSIAVRVQYLLSQMKQQSQVHLWEPIYFLLTEDIEGDSESESGDGSKSSRKTCK